MNKLSNLKELQAEANHKFQEGTIQEYGIVTIPSDEVSVHLLLPTEGITWRQFPPNNLKLADFKFEEDVRKEKERDFFLTNLSADGFFVSEKAKAILEGFNLGSHRFFKSSRVLRKGGLFKKAVKEDYYWLHLVFDDQTDDFVDFENSTFRKRIKRNGKLISSELVGFKSAKELHDFKHTKHDLWKNDSDNNDFYEIKAWELSLNTYKELPDILGFSRIDTNEYYFSSELAAKLISEDLKGIKIRKTGKIKSR